MQTIDEILKDINENGLNVSEISRKTGIPGTRIYKWLKGKGKPKAEDADKMKAWASSKSEVLPNSGKTVPQPNIIEPSQYEALQAKYIKALEDDKAYFQELLRSSLVSLVGQVRDVGLRQKGAAEVVLHSLERLEKKKTGELVRAADMRMVQIEKEAERRGSDAVPGR